MENSIKKIYIAGKITGLQISEVEAKFLDAKKRLEKEGYKVINPILVINDWNCEWHDAMRKCIAELITCDCICLLSDWQESRGAIIEREIAIAIGLSVIKLKS